MGSDHRYLGLCVARPLADAHDVRLLRGVALQRCTALWHRTAWTTVSYAQLVLMYWFSVLHKVYDPKWAQEGDLQHLLTNNWPTPWERLLAEFPRSCALLQRCTLLLRPGAAAYAGAWAVGRRCGAAGHARRHG